MNSRRSSNIIVITFAVFTLSLLTLFYRSVGAHTKTNNASMLAPGIIATKTDALDSRASDDLNGNGIVNPGDV